MRHKIKSMIIKKIIAPKCGRGLGRTIILSYLLTKSYKASKPTK